MKDLYHHFNLALTELIWFLILQGVVLIIFAVLALFYPYFLVIIVAFLLICLAVFSAYFGFKIWGVKRKLNKVIKLK
jgi:cellulose synthase/poly-beta-1,6-N-acetylglucosamine synthase-like glycosyltransferase